MTYCVGMLLNDGLVMVSDSRTNASVDNVAIYRKMHVWEKKGDRVIVLMTAGNLSVSQSIVTLLNEGVPGTAKRATMNSVQRMSDAARLVRRSFARLRQVIARRWRRTTRAFRSKSFSVARSVVAPYASTCSMPRETSSRRSPKHLMFKLANSYVANRSLIGSSCLRPPWSVRRNARWYRWTRRSRATCLSVHRSMF